MFEGQANTVELHKLVHWSYLKKLIKKVAHMNRINISEYDIHNIRVYEATGLTFQGSNVKTNLKNNGSPFTVDNHFEIYEIPRKNKKVRYLGDFMFLVYNKGFDYWMSGIVNYGKDFEVVNFQFMKGFEFITKGKDFKISHQWNIESELMPPTKTSFKFDRFNIRKRAYQVALPKPKNSQFIDKKTPVKKK